MTQRTNNKHKVKLYLWFPFS